LRSPDGMLRRKSAAGPAGPHLPGPCAMRRAFGNSKRRWGRACEAPSTVIAQSPDAVGALFVHDSEPCMPMVRWSERRPSAASLRVSCSLASLFGLTTARRPLLRMHRQRRHRACQWRQLQASQRWTARSSSSTETQTSRAQTIVTVASTLQICGRNHGIFRTAH